MVMLRVKEVSDGPPILQTLPAHKPLMDLESHADLREEIDAMVMAVQLLDLTLMDQVMATCTALMARATELKIMLIRTEMNDRKLRALRTQELEPVMELVDFTFRAASRMVEIRRQDMELSK